jgi:hypothetical protein
MLARYSNYRSTLVFSSLTRVSLDDESMPAGGTETHVKPLSMCLVPVNPGRKQSTNFATENDRLQDGPL